MICSEQCIDCDLIVSAVTFGALGAAMQDHADYVNHAADRADDPHFESARMDALLA